MPIRPCAACPGRSAVLESLTTMTAGLHRTDAGLTAWGEAGARLPAPFAQTNHSWTLLGESLAAGILSPI